MQQAPPITHPLCFAVVLARRVATDVNVCRKGFSLRKKYGYVYLGAGAVGAPVQ